MFYNTSQMREVPRNYLDFVGNSRKVFFDSRKDMLLKSYPKVVDFR